MTEKNKIWLVLVVLMGLLLPGVAAAAVIHPPGNLTDWDLWVFGNGYVIKEVLSGVKMLMSSDNSSFQMILLFLATVGFLSLAISAGFDPGKNLMRMFMYIIAVWMVIFASTSLTANVVVTDLVFSGDAEGQGTPVHRVTEVPALVAMPAVITSAIGKYMTEGIETYFSTVRSPADGGGGMNSTFTITGGGGQFNLYNRMVEDADKFSFTSTAMKQSFSAYVSDCVIFGIARGRLQADELNTSNNLMETFAKASTPSIMTRYYVAEDEPTEWLAQLGSDVTPESAKTMGVLVSCEMAYQRLQVVTEKFAENMLEAKASSWSKSGIFVPYGEAFTSMIAGAAGGAGTPGGRANGYILQQAMLNYKSGAFRDAAMQTGNNEIMQAAAISQAEASRTSGWVAGFAMFNSMMGYVFAVLQSFIFAVTPLIVMALMIPGMGKSIFVNYAQILIWLMLWAPMFAVINFVITLFGSAEFSDAIGANGLNGNNKYIISESAKNLVVAGQFLGTMVPMITWGLVKGAMAFTEFINSGIGTSFANSAGAQAASGNMSMNNTSMDSTSIGKYSTALSSSVGFQDVQGLTNAGGASIEQSLGGTKTTANGAGVQYGRQLQEAQQRALSHVKEVGSALSEMRSQGLTESKMQEIASDKGRTLSQRQAATQALAAMRSAQQENSSSTGESSSEANKSSTSANAGTTSSASLGVGIPGGFLNIGTNQARKEGIDASAGTDRSAGSTASTGDKNATSKSGQSSNSYQDSQEAANSAGTTQRASASESQRVEQAISKSLSENQKLAETLQASVNLSNTSGYSMAMDAHSARNLIEKLDRLSSELPSMDSLEAQSGALRSSLSSAYGLSEREIGAGGARAGETLSSLQRGASGSNGLDTARTSVGAEVNTVTTSASAEISNTGSQVQSARTARHNEAVNANQDALGVTIAPQHPNNFVNSDTPQPQTTQGDRLNRAFGGTQPAEVNLPIGGGAPGFSSNPSANDIPGR
ncbi:conjugal transfer protein TraG N-terminal domain-containing protein [Nostoc sp. CHAB 5834]|nr:conjugal transfer protein TraG N-terminal domain-containing protein [Nostoc sp. CHAB 5834]